MLEQKSWKEYLLPYLPERIADAVGGMDERVPLEEIRIRAARPLQLCFSGFERMIYAPGGRPMAEEKDLSQIVARLCGHSMYAWESEMSGGFITLGGGCRVGICGRCVQEGERLHHAEDVTSVNFRIARERFGAASALLPRIRDAGNRLLPTLIVSAPGCGKTTMLRDIARQCSDGLCGMRPHRVAIVDTRYELAGCVRGAPHFSVGARTDVRTGGVRAEGIRQMVLTMSPEIIVTDELSCTEDAYAVLDAVSAGVTVAASAHAGSLASLQKRPPLLGLLHEGVFSRYVLLDRSRGVGTVRAVFDENGREIGEVGQKWQRLLRC